jgi:hypothetical protein
MTEKFRVQLVNGKHCIMLRKPLGGEARGFADLSYYLVGTVWEALEDIEHSVLAVAWDVRVERSDSSNEPEIHRSYSIEIEFETLSDATMFKMMTATGD